MAGQSLFKTPQWYLIPSHEKSKVLMVACKNHVIGPPYSHFLSDLISTTIQLLTPSSLLLINQALVMPLPKCSSTCHHTAHSLTSFKSFLKGHPPWVEVLLGQPTENGNFPSPTPYLSSLV